MQDTIPIILSNLSIPNILKSSTINKLFHQSYKSNIIWKSQLSKTFNTTTLQKSTYYKTFKHLYQSTQLVQIFDNNQQHVTIDNIPIIQSLHKSHYNMHKIPSSISKFKSLHTLSLMHQQNPHIPTQIGNLQTLKKLILLNCQLKTLPNEIYQLTNLQNLDISHNNLKELSPTIGNLINLKSLDVYYNCFKTLPSEIDNLTNLTSFNYGNPTHTMQSIKNLTNLQSLTMGNMDVIINQEICNLPSLTNIQLKSIKSFTIPKDFTINKDIKFIF
jgi:leucine-rich repeat protein SHOC2